MRLAFLQIHDAPYRMDFLRHLAEQESIELSVYTYESADKNHLYWDIQELGYDSRSLGPFLRIGPSLFHFKLLNPFFIRQFDAVAVMAHSNITSLLAFFWCKVWGTPYIYMADTVEERMTGRLITKIKKSIYGNALFLFVTGKASKHFYMGRYNIPEDKIMTGYYNFEFDRIHKLVAEGREMRTENRTELGVMPSDVLSVMVANFLPFRDHLALIKSFDFRNENKLLLVGEGEHLDTCKSYVHQNSLKDKVLFLSGLPFENMVRLLAACDIYVHSGKEPYSTMPILAKLVGLKFGYHGDIPAYYDLENNTVPVELDAPVVVKRFTDKLKYI